MSAALAAAVADAVGQRATHSRQIGSTRDTGVCCNMNSLTRICHGVTSESRHGRSRRDHSYQSRSSRCVGESFIACYGRMSGMPNTDPVTAWKSLKEGNERVVARQREHPSQSVEHRANLTKGQQPTSALFGCGDSRGAGVLLCV